MVRTRGQGRPLPARSLPAPARCPSGCICQRPGDRARTRFASNHRAGSVRTTLRRRRSPAAAPGGRDHLWSRQPGPHGRSRRVGSEMGRARSSPPRSCSIRRSRLSGAGSVSAPWVDRVRGPLSRTSWRSRATQRPQMGFSIDQGTPDGTCQAASRRSSRERVRPPTEPTAISNPPETAVTTASSCFVLSPVRSAPGAWDAHPADQMRKGSRSSSTTTNAPRSSR